MLASRKLLQRQGGKEMAGQRLHGAALASLFSTATHMRCVDNCALWYFSQVSSFFTHQRGQYLPSEGNGHAV